MGLFSFFNRNKNKLQGFLDRDAILLDVRTHQEYNEGSIDGALHIPLKEVSSNIDTLKKKNAPIIAFCKSGGRSAIATGILKKHGIEALNGGGKNSLERKL
ncbi:rhodanese-like domain-containing protein [Patiriisocius hiemis]|uniref:Rhodanese-like domain-containing protein n=1 Tax=Patiriisocius hiemis TaxID=3075604 RepID=A0ABU2YCH0_9FLAO|nr:rhodanese-like domain-containing protein [Constantimarinum sp. W242]MDT0555861.1 rhodanese-like domain-containing protein [Constantimarinum sp. W242]